MQIIQADPLKKGNSGGQGMSEERLVGDCPLGVSSLLKEEGLVALAGQGWQLCELALKKLELSQE